MTKYKKWVVWRIMYARGQYLTSDGSWTWYPDQAIYWTDRVAAEKTSYNFNAYIGGIL